MELQTEIDAPDFRAHNRRTFMTRQTVTTKDRKSTFELHQFIHACHGKFKGKMGDKPFAEEWEEYKREEKELEERKFQRFADMGKK